LKSVFANRKKRSSEEIVASMLVSAKRGVSKTGIMYASYLSFSQLNKYIVFALKANLLQMDDKGKFITTQRGVEYLKCFEEVRNMENNAFAKRRLLDDILKGEPET